MISADTLSCWQLALKRRDAVTVLEGIGQLQPNEHNELTLQFEALATAMVAGPAEALTQLSARDVVGGLRGPKPSTAILELAVRLALAAGEWHKVEPWVLQALPRSTAELRRRLIDFWAMAANQTGNYEDCLRSARSADVDIRLNVHLASLLALEMLERQGSINQSWLSNMSERFAAQATFWQLLDLHRCRHAPSTAPRLDAKARPKAVEELTPRIVVTFLRLPDLYPDDHARAARLNDLADHLGWLREVSVKRKFSPEHIAGVPFRLAYQTEDHLPIQEAWSNWVAGIMTQVSEPQTEIVSDRFTILIVTAHWRECTVNNYFKAHYEALWGREIRVIIIALGRTDEVSRRAAARAQAFHELPNQHTSIKQVLALVQQYKPHVCLYPEVGMEPVVNALAALRLAPVQACFWGHPASTALNTLDAFITAAAMEDENMASHYSEVPIALPGLGTSFPWPEFVPAVQPDAKVSTKAPTLLCAQSPFKWQPEFIQALGRVMKALPMSRLRLFHNVSSISQQGILRTLTHAWAPLCVDPLERVDLLPTQSRTAFLQTLSESDVVVDTFLFSGGQTTVDSLTVGVPPITLPGKHMRGRQTAAMLKASNLQACVACDVEDWIGKIIEQASNASLRAELREQARQVAKTALTDDAPVRAMMSWIEALRSVMLGEGKTGREAVLAAKSLAGLA